MQPTILNHYFELLISLSLKVWKNSSDPENKIMYDERNLFTAAGSKITTCPQPAAKMTQ
jgi:hypothetical protein